MSRCKSRLHLICARIIPNHFESEPLIHLPCRVDLNDAQFGSSSLASRVVEKSRDKVGADASTLEFRLDHHHLDHDEIRSFQYARRADGNLIDGDYFKT